MLVSIHQSDLQESTDKLEDDFSMKLKINEDDLESLKDKQEQDNEEGDDDDGEEFSFACMNPDGSPISADDVFQNGQIRPIFPLFNRDLLFPNEDSDSESKNLASTSIRSPLKEVYVETEPEGPYCEWTKKPPEMSPELCKKSNSTGFSKLRRFRELVLRSNSDGKDAFVFLHHNNKIEKSKETMTEKEKKVCVKKDDNKKTTTKSRETASSSSSSAHERLYVRNRAIKEEHKRKSYLPYRVGFFTNVNGLSRNVHPY